jgi:hypothetical protein
LAVSGAMHYVRVTSLFLLSEGPPRAWRTQRKRAGAGIGPSPAPGTVRRPWPWSRGGADRPDAERVASGRGGHAGRMPGNNGEHRGTPGTRIRCHPRHRHP